MIDYNRGPECELGQIFLKSSFAVEISIEPDQTVVIRLRPRTDPNQSGITITGQTHWRLPGQEPKFHEF